MVDDRIVAVSAHVTRVRAPNPSPMTLEGTNSYLIDTGNGTAAVVDPGPAIDEHLRTLAAAAEDARLAIAAILVTHGHPDHAPGAAGLRALTGAPVYAHPQAKFSHDIATADGEPVLVGTTPIGVEFAPGHARDHLVFTLAADRALFTGDVVIGRGTVVVAPPGGDMRAYQATLARLRANHSDARAILGGHGARIERPVAKLDEYIAHRAAREAALLDILREGKPQTIPQIVERLYAETPRVLWPAAARQTLAYLEALEREGRVRAHRLDRAPTAVEAEILHPDLARVVDEQSAAVARAELGFEDAGAPLFGYEAA